ncbi:hypothetical protein PBAL39_17061 [Pedobacter sp. BAL39]|uniref:hypothetical protein n=1 Tax=Pedobacter sp. BAL39 TaxID=391596 RepID=UPI0001559576|nr:hypothetical protein [Pedobacter sp. BAL39]EDM35212.1 hypothetical protein PBAL39_17061 [Pedobacter sp. BAL39]
MKLSIKLIALSAVLLTLAVINSCKKDELKTYVIETTGRFAYYAEQAKKEQAEKGKVSSVQRLKNNATISAVNDGPESCSGFMDYKFNYANHGVPDWVTTQLKIEFRQKLQYNLNLTFPGIFFVDVNFISFHDSESYIANQTKNIIAQSFNEVAQLPPYNTYGGLDVLPQDVTVIEYDVICTPKSTTDPTNPNDPNNPNDPGSGGGGTPGDPNDPNNPMNPEPNPPKEDPCDRVTEVINNASNPNITDQNNNIRNAGNMSVPPREFGADEKLNTLVDGDYKYTNTRAGGAQYFEANFTWNSQDGYSTGFSHYHPDGTAPSPLDAFELLRNLTLPGLAGGSSSDIAFYKQHASLTTISSTGQQYTLTIADWGLLKGIYETRYATNPTKFINEFNALANKYLADHPLSTEAEATEYALKGKLGNSINLFKKDGSILFKYIEINSQQGNVTGTVKKTGC